MTACANCSKKIRTESGMAFHLGWCKPAETPEPVAVPEPVTVAVEAPVVMSPRRLIARGRMQKLSANRPLCLVCRANYRDYATHATSQRHARATRPAVSRNAGQERPAWMVAMNSYRETGNTYDHAEPEPVWDGIPQA